ncbi:MAG: magnesium transporter [Verrucomicrobia bacterium]|nr:magnesium transporter [Verrucomicrobiota bacterium]
MRDQTASNHFAEPVLQHARKDFCTLSADLTVDGALVTIRRQGLGERIVYFYVVDAEGKLQGVLPTRRLLMGQPEAKISDMMIRRVISIPSTATLLDACECFILHKFLAFPVVDENRVVVGVVDVSMFTGEMQSLEERERWDTAFEAIGFRINQVRGASPWQGFRFRFPWLVATLLSGTLCAFLTSAYELTLANSLVLAFFLTLVLGLGESVSVQAMTLAIQTLRNTHPTWRWWGSALARETGTSLLLGLACGLAVAGIASVWRGLGVESLVLGLSVLLALVTACVVGLSIPTLLHAFRWDPKIAAGPLTLAVTDIFTLLIYFNLGRAWL